MPLTKKDDGKFYDENGNVINVTQEELNKLAIVDKEAVLKEQLKDRYNLEPDQLKNIDQIANEARKQEKQKLYQEIEDHKKRAKTAEDQARALQGQLDTLTPTIDDLKKQLEESKDKGNKGKGDPALEQKIKEMEAKVQQIEADKKKAIEEADKRFNDYRTDMQKAIDRDKLDRYRAEKIAEAGGRIIPELVLGETQEAIDLSIEKAKQRYEEIMSAEEKRREEEAKKKGSKSTDFQTDTKITLEKGGNQLSAEDLAKMSDADYAKYREKMLTAAGSRRV